MPFLVLLKSLFWKWGRKLQLLLIRSNHYLSCNITISHEAVIQKMEKWKQRKRQWNNFKNRTPWSILAMPMVLTYLCPWLASGQDFYCHPLPILPLPHPLLPSISLPSLLPSMGNSYPICPCTWFITLYKHDFHIYGSTPSLKPWAPQRQGPVLSHRCVPEL